MQDEILEYIKDSVDRIEAKQDKHSDRLNEVERWQSNANGKMTMLSIMGMTIGGLMTGIVEYFRH